MQLTKAAAVLSFFVLALAIGVASVYVVDSRKETAVVDGPADLPTATPGRTPVKLELPLGKWTGQWGHDLGACTIEINRVDGANFYGTLIKKRAKIALTGTLDQNTGRLTILETKVLALGDYDGWSLGEDTGVLSADLGMSGTGTDKWGEYSWVVTYDK